jgi:hypothetical protein
VRVLLLTHDRADPSFRVRWERFRPVLRAGGVETVVREVPRFFRAATWRAARRFDVTVLHRRLLTARHFRRLRRHARRLVFDFDDALCYRAAPPHRSWTRARRFFRTVGAADLVLAGNRVLAGHARLRARRVLVLPSTVDPYPAAKKLGEFTAVWIGQRATLPHLETVRPALLEAGFRVRVIADAAPAGVEHVPWSLDAEGPRLAECHAGLMPLPRTPFTRGKCGYKLLQYFAAGLPAVASSVGVNRTLAEGGAVLAGTPDEWVAALSRLRDDADARRDLGVRGRCFALRRYGTTSMGQRLLRILQGLG